jgi:hypothetical protein
MRKTAFVLLVVSFISSNALAATKVSNIKVNVDTDEVGDKTVVISLKDADKQENLYFRCRDNELDIVFEGEGGLYDPDSVGIKWKFDKYNSHPRGSWDLSTDHTALFVPSEEKMTFLKEARGSKSLTLIDSSTGIKAVYKYSLIGFASASKALTCGK